MGKRKFVGESKDTTKRSKSDGDAENSDNHKSISEEPKKGGKRPPKTTKTKLFDIKHFRKELAGKQGQTMGRWTFTNHHYSIVTCKFYRFRCSTQMYLLM